MKKEINTYEINVKCDNCNKENKIKIKKGISVAQLKGFWNDVYLIYKCENCGCKRLQPKNYDC